MSAGRIAWVRIFTLLTPLSFLRRRGKSAMKIVQTEWQKFHLNVCLNMKKLNLFFGALCSHPGCLFSFLFANRVFSSALLRSFCEMIAK